MCGIAGIIGETSLEEDLQKMLQVQEYCYYSSARIKNVLVFLFYVIEIIKRDFKITVL